MISEERLVWLLGVTRPVRVIPSSIPATDKDRIVPGAHTLLRELVVPEPHPAWIDGVHNETLHHEHESGVHHHVVVSSANRMALDAHLDSAEISLLATPAATIEGPKPVRLRHVVAEAVLEVTGSTVSELLAERGGEEPLHYDDLLDADGDAVRARAVDGLADGLRQLEEARVLDAEDLEALDPESLVGLYLRAAAADPPVGSLLGKDPSHADRLRAQPGAVFTRFGPESGGHDLSYSIKDLHSVPYGSWKYYGPTYSVSSSSETVTVSSGSVNMDIIKWINSAWTPIWGPAYSVTTSKTTPALTLSYDSSGYYVGLYGNTQGGSGATLSGFWNGAA